MFRGRRRDTVPAEAREPEEDCADALRSGAYAQQRLNKVSAVHIECQEESLVTAVSVEWGPPFEDLSQIVLRNKRSGLRFDNAAEHIHLFRRFSASWN